MGAATRYNYLLHTVFLPHAPLLVYLSNQGSISSFTFLVVCIIILILICISEIDFNQFSPNFCSQVSISGGNLVGSSSSNFLERSSSHQLSSGDFLGMCIYITRLHTSHALLIPTMRAFVLTKTHLTKKKGYILLNGFDNSNSVSCLDFFF